MWVAPRDVAPQVTPRIHVLLTQETLPTSSAGSLSPKGASALVHPNRRTTGSSRDKARCGHMVHAWVLHTMHLLSKLPIMKRKMPDECDCEPGPRCEQAQFR